MSTRDLGGELTGLDCGLNTGIVRMNRSSLHVQENSSVSESCNMTDGVQAADRGNPGGGSGLSSSLGHKIVVLRT